MPNNQSKIIDLNLLSETIELMNKAKDFQVIADIIFKFIKRFINFNMAVIYKINEKENILEIVSCLGSDAEKLKRRIPIKIGESAVGLVARDKKPILINDVFESGNIKVRQYYDEDPLIRTFLAVPLVVGDKAIGILSVSSSVPNEYGEYDVQMINIIASQGAVLLELNNNITETQKFSNQILENVNSGVLVVNNDKKIIIFNKSAEKITGFESSEILGSEIFNIQLKLDNEEDFILQCIDNGKTYFEEPGYMIRKDEKILRIRFSTSLMYDEDKTVKSCICIFRDNTEIERLEKQIAMADKLTALGRLTAGIVHEIRNPLLPIRNASEYLLSKYSNSGNEDVNSLLSIIREESERLNRVLEQLVNIGKDSYYTIGNCSLKDVIVEIISLFKFTFRNNKINLNCDLDFNDIILPLNKDNLKQVFINLILNSIDAINLNENNSKLRNITIKTVKYADSVFIEINDTGIGILKSEINKIFDPFYSTKDNGTGIGLSIVFNIVKSSGGKISIESIENIGTKVSLTLPIIN